MPEHLVREKQQINIQYIAGKGFPLPAIKAYK